MLGRLVAAVVIMITCCGAAKVKPVKVALFITAQERGGFMEIDRSIADSSKDLASAFERISEVRVVRSRTEAEIVLIVSTRGVGSQARGDTLLLLPLGKGVIGSSTPVLQKDYWLSTVLGVGPTYSKEFVGKASNQTRNSMGAWSTCARMVAEDVQAWIVGNQAQLDGLRRQSNRR